MIRGLTKVARTFATKAFVPVSFPSSNANLLLKPHTNYNNSYAEIYTDIKKIPSKYNGLRFLIAEVEEENVKNNHIETFKTNGLCEIFADKSTKSVIIQPIVPHEVHLSQGLVYDNTIESIANSTNSTSTYSSNNKTNTCNINNDKSSNDNSKRLNDRINELNNSVEKLKNKKESDQQYKIAIICICALLCIFGSPWFAILLILLLL